MGRKEKGNDTSMRVDTGIRCGCGCGCVPCVYKQAFVPPVSLSEERPRLCRSSGTRCLVSGQSQESSAAAWRPAILPEMKHSAKLPPEI